LRIVRCFAAGIAAAVTLLAQQPPEAQELLGALARTAELFSHTAPELGAREVLSQRARHGDMKVLRRGRHNELKKITFSLPDQFTTHEIVSDYRLGPAGPAGGFHEIRTILTIDHASPAASSAEVRHAMTLGLNDPDDSTKKELLESLELERLQGAAADFGPILLLFTAARQHGSRFTTAGRHALPSGAAAWVLNYRQTGGNAAMTEFRSNAAVKHVPEGQIWFREEDLLPIRITLNADELVAPKYSLRNEAEVDYQPTRHGLAPRAVTHRQYVNEDLLVENRFTYSDYRGVEMAP